MDFIIHYTVLNWNLYRDVKWPQKALNYSSGPHDRLGGGGGSGCLSNTIKIVIILKYKKHISIWKWIYWNIKPQIYFNIQVKYINKKVSNDICCMMEIGQRGYYGEEICSTETVPQWNVNLLTTWVWAVWPTAHRETIWSTQRLPSPLSYQRHVHSTANTKKVQALSSFTQVPFK